MAMAVAIAVVVYTLRLAVYYVHKPGADKKI